MAWQEAKIRTCTHCGGPHTMKTRRTCSDACAAARVGASTVGCRSPSVRAKRAKQKRTKYRRPDKATVIEALTEKQRGLCASCAEALPLVLDHDHCTGEPRGMLCVRCNAALGLMLEDPAKILGLMSYAEACKPKCA